MFHACEYSTGTVLSQPTTSTILNGGDCVETTVINFKKLIKCEIVQNSTSQVDSSDDNAKDNNKRVVTAINTENPKSESFTDIINKFKYNDKSKSVNDKNLTRTNEHEKVNNNDLVDQTINLKSKENTNKVEKRNSFLSHITNGKSVFDNMKKFIVKKSAANTDLNRNLSNNGRAVNANLDSNTNVKENTDVVDYW